MLSVWTKRFCWWGATQDFRTISAMLEATEPGTISHDMMFACPRLCLNGTRRKPQHCQNWKLKIKHKVATQRNVNFQHILGIVDICATFLSFLSFGLLPVRGRHSASSVPWRAEHHPTRPPEVFYDLHLPSEFAVSVLMPDAIVAHLDTQRNFQKCKSWQ